MSPRAREAAERFRVSDFLHAASSLGFVSVTAFAFQIALARLLSVEEFGSMRVARAVLEFVAIPASFGMASCLSRWAGVARNAAERAAAREVALAWALGGSLVVAAGVAVLYRVLPGLVTDAAARDAIGTVVWAIVPLAIFTTLRGWLQGTGRVRALAGAQASRGAAQLVLGSLATWMGGLGGWVAGRILTDAFAAFAAMGLSFGRRESAATTSPATSDSASPGDLVREFGRFGAFAALTQTVFATFTTADILLMDRLLGAPAALARYGVATLLFQTALLLPNAFVQAHFHRMAAAAPDIEATRRLLRRYTGFAMAMAAPAAIGCFFGAALIPALFGEEYREAVGLFRALIPAFAIQCAGVVAGNFVVAVGRVGWNLGAMLVVATLNVALHATLLPRMGAAGAVVATTITYAALTLSARAILELHFAAARRTATPSRPRPSRDAD